MTKPSRVLALRKSAFLDPVDRALVQSPRPSIQASTDRPWLHSFIEYLAAAVSSVIILVGVLKLWRADLTVPLAYSNDALSMQMLTKCLIDNNSSLHNAYIGAPFGCDLHDYPKSDSLHLFSMWLISQFSPNYAVVYNLYYLLTFPLSTLTCLYALRRFQVSFPSALLCGLLFAFTPYHFLKFQRPFGHYFEACYYLVPLMGVLILRVYQGQVPVLDRGKRAFLAVAFCVVFACAGVYYAFFACCLLLAVAGFTSLSRRTWSPLWNAAILILAVTLGVLLNLIPTFTYVARHGANTQAVERHPGESEEYGLKMTQLLLPIDQHRIPPLARLKDRYNATAPLVNENRCAALGALGGLGFFATLGWFLYRGHAANGRQLFGALGFLNGVTVLLATVGGLGAFCCYTLSRWLPVLPWIRGYNRISVYVAFFSLFALALLLETIRHAYVRTPAARFVFRAFILLLALAGILDQTTSAYVPDYGALQTQFHNDGAFVRQIEASVPSNAMIFVLPCVSYPEHLPIHGLRDYDLFRGYLHSRTLHWSYGNLKGRDGDLWQQDMASLPVEELVPLLAYAGFRGIYIDRNGYRDDGVNLETRLEHILKHAPLVDGQKRLAFFALTDFSNDLRAKHTDAEWEALSRQALQRRALPLEWKAGFQEPDADTESAVRWCGASGELILLNPSRSGKEVTLELVLATEQAKPLDLRIRSSLFSTELTLRHTETRLSRTLLIPSGKHTLVFMCVPGQHSPVPTRAFKVIHCSARERSNN